MDYFVAENSVVRKIWGNGDTILFIFSGAAAEFALNKAVDWLYFTGKLPADPIGRLFSTVCYAQQIVFASAENANRAIDQISAIHSKVEANRQAKIPDWAYRDVLYMLIHYSVAAHELLQKRLTTGEKEEVFDVFARVGRRMQLKDLPNSYSEWLDDYALHLQNDLEKGNYTVDLFKQYKKHLGNFRYWVLIETQKLVVPARVKQLLGFSSFSFVPAVLPIYKFARLLHLHRAVRSLLLPNKYKQKIAELDQA